MNESGFRDWLKNQGYNSRTINARVSNCLRVCEGEGDLDVLYKHDQCNLLLDKLTYSSVDEKSNNPVKHNMNISGNQRTGTATLKQAANLYIRFIEYENNHSITLNNESSNPTLENSPILSAPDKGILDSYAIFLNYFAIDKDAFYSFGLENTIFADLEYMRLQWKTVKEKLLNNQPLYIRSYGRQGRNTDLFIGLYKFIFKNSCIIQDPSNNTAAKRNLQLATKHRVNISLFNFQCSHIFGHTKNPLMFEAVWNICFTPKIFDPLTGHETKGNWPDEYQSLFQNMVYTRHAEFIKDYNDFVHENDILTKIDRYIDSVKELYGTALLKKFEQDAKNEWSELTHSEEVVF